MYLGAVFVKAVVGKMDVLLQTLLHLSFYYLLSLCKGAPKNDVHYLLVPAGSWLLATLYFT